MTTVLTIDEMFRQVPEGETRLFEAPIKGAVEDRFFSVRYNNFCGISPEWHNVLPFEEMPWLGDRFKARIPISVLPPLDVTYEGNSFKIVDFYARGGLQVYFISDRLLALIEDLDPDSVNHRPMTIKATDGSVDFNVVMPARSLDVIDPERTDVLIKDQKLATQWFRRIQFPNGVVFRQDVLTGVHNFSDFHVNVWFWSRELIERAKAAGIKGVRAKRAGMITGPDEYAF